MKIAFCRHSLLNRGGDKMVLIYANHLANMGYEVTIYTNILKTNFVISNNIKLKEIPYSTKFGTIFWVLINRIKADIVIADIIVMATLLYFGNPNRVVYFAQDYDVSYYQDSLRRAIIRLIYKFALTIPQSVGR